MEEDISIVTASESYISSYWYAFDSIAKEKKYFASTRAYPYDTTYEMVIGSIKRKIPCFFIVKGNEVIGFGDAQPRCKKIGYIGIGIISGYRGKGLGQALMKKIMDESKEYGYERLEIDVRKDNVNAIKLYEKLGFKTIRELENIMELEGKKITILQMEKILNF